MLTAYRANPNYGPGPAEGSWAWKLEREIERQMHPRYAVVMNSGTAALHCALAYLGLQPGDEVITSALTFSATAAAIVMAGGTPRFADVDAETFCITPKTVEPLMSSRTRAVLVVHLFGHVQEGWRLGSHALIEDACQAVGCRGTLGYAGTLGMAGAYSFGSRKQVTAGEAGALVTDSPGAALYARHMMNHAENFDRDFVGYNYRPNEATCKAALSSLKRLKHGTPFLKPYLVKRRGPGDKPYLSKHLGEYRAFRRYAVDPLPVTEWLVKEALCVR